MDDRVSKVSPAAPPARVLLMIAVTLLTRVPMPAIARWEAEWTSRASRFFPLVGAGVGVVCGIVFVAASTAWPGSVAAVLAVGAGILVTGAFHEDGLADAADGLGGGQDRIARLAIMKESTIGTFGTLALGMVVGAKIAALAEMTPWLGATALVATHGAARAAAVATMRAGRYAGEVASAKIGQAADGVTARDAAIAVGFGVLSCAPMAAMAPGRAALAVVAAGVGAALVRRQARRLIGGWVGDTLGAGEQVFEAIFLITAASNL